MNAFEDVLGDVDLMLSAIDLHPGTHACASTAYRVPRI